MHISLVIMYAWVIPALFSKLIDGKMTPTYVESNFIPVFIVTDYKGPSDTLDGFSVSFKVSKEENSIVTF